MNDKKSFQITDPEHLLQLGTVLGLLTAIEAIKKQQDELGKVVGLGVAKHAVIAQEANARISFMQSNMRTAYKEFGSLEGYELACSSTGLLTLDPVDDPP